MIERSLIAQAPKVLLHDHLDGGLRPSTVIDLARESGYDGLPTTDPDELAQAFTAGANRKSLELYLEGFEHTVGGDADPRGDHSRGRGMRRGSGRRRRRLRRGALRAGAEHARRPVARRGRPKRSCEGFDRGSREPRHRDGLHRHGHAPVRALGRDRRAGDPPPRSGRRRLRRRRTGGGLSADSPPGRLQPHPPGQLPPDHPCRRGVRPAVHLGGTPVVRRRIDWATGCASWTTSRSTTTARSPWAGSRATCATQRVPLEMCPTSNVHTGAAASIEDASDRSPAPAPLPGHGQHRQPADERHHPEPTSSSRCHARSTLASTRCSG